jgi:hypothetical protein
LQWLWIEEGIIECWNTRGIIEFGGAFDETVLYLRQEFMERFANQLRAREGGHELQRNCNQNE